MEAVIFCGAPGSGKSTFFKEHFFDTHLRISLDLLRTRKRERLFFDTALKAGQRLVIDNTNPTADNRRLYIEAARAAHFTLAGYYFTAGFEEALERNNLRTGRARVPEAAIKSFLAKLERPALAEGFDRLYQVAVEDSRFLVSELKHEI